MPSLQGCSSQSFRSAYPSDCEHACCTGCLERWLAVKPCCPVCREEVSVHRLQPLPRALWFQLSSLQVRCDYLFNGCQAVLPLGSLRSHAQECTHQHSTVDSRKGTKLPPGAAVLNHSTSTLSVESILNAPTTQPVSPVEDRIFGRLVSRLCHQHQSSVGLPFFTGGR